MKRRARFTAGFAAVFAVLALACDAIPYEIDLSGGEADQAPAASGAASAAPPATASAAAAAAPTAPTTAAEKPPEPVREPPPGPVVDITSDAIASIRTSSEQFKFGAKNLFDHNPKTAWVEDSPSDGEGHWVEVTLTPGTYVAYVEVSAGWGSETRFKEDLWEINTSVREMRVSWDSGEGSATFVRSTDRGKKKKVEVAARTEKLRFTAEAVSVGKFEELAIDDHNIFGVLSR
jgi:hypothetical protein